MTPLSKHIRATVALLLALFVCTSPANADNIKRKGRFLHTEIEKYEDTTSFSVTLVKDKETSFPVFKIHRQILRTVHEVKVFETVVDTVNDNEEGNVLQDYRNLRIIPNEFIKDQRTTRQETLYEGPFKNTAFTIDGITLVTNDKGLITDSKQFWLSKLDDLSLNAIDVTVEHPNYGKQTATLTRLILRPAESIQPQYKKDCPNATLDLLEGLGLDFTLSTQTTREAVSFTCRLPEKCAAGDIIAVSLEATNTTDKTCGNLFFCTFSREPWLDGKLFYIGNLASGQKRTFTRLFTVPDTLTNDIAHLLIAPWDTNKAHSETAKHLTIRLK